MTQSSQSRIAYDPLAAPYASDLDAAELERLKDRGARVGTRGRLLTPEMALAGADYFRADFGNQTAAMIAEEFGLTINDVGPMVPVPCRPDFAVQGQHADGWLKRAIEAEVEALTSLEPVIVNSSTPILESRPKGWLALRKKLDAAGWSNFGVWGQTPGLAVRELVRSDDGPGHFETTLIEVVSLSLRCYRGRERGIAIWSTRDDGGTWTYELGLYRGLTGSMGIRSWTRAMMLAPGDLSRRRMTFR